MTSFPDDGAAGAVLGQPLEPRVILLDPQAPDGYVRDWHPPGIPAMQNFAYAFEWWCFAVAAVVIWVVLSTQRPKEIAHDATDARELRSRNLRTLAALAALFFLPLLVSAWLYYGIELAPGGHVNHGELIQPPRPLPHGRSAAHRARPVSDRAEQPGPAPDPTLFRSNWTLVYVGRRKLRCLLPRDALCHAADAARAGHGHDAAGAGLPGHGELLRAGIISRASTPASRSSMRLAPRARSCSAGSRRQTGRTPLFVVDPLGNLMMRYDVRRDPRGLLVDLKRLLELSQIG